MDMKKVALCGMMAFAAGVMTGCRTPTTRVDIMNDRGGAVASLDYRDVREAAQASLTDIYKSGRLDRPDGGMYVMTVGKVKNDTMQRNFDTDILTSYITDSLMRSGKIILTSAMAAGADNRDEMINAVRSVRGNDEFSQAAIAKKGQLAPPTHSIFGKIIQREVRMDNGDKQIEYYFILHITELASGLQWWMKEYPIVKRTDAGTPTW